MKRYLCILLVVLMLVLPCAVHAQSPKIVDNAGLLTAQERSELEATAQNLADTYGIDVVILTVDSLGYKGPQAYADDYFDENGYGIGADYSGVLLLLSMEERDWAISTCGKGISALTDYGIDAAISRIAPYLSKDQFYSAFRTYLRVLEDDFEAYERGEPVDVPQRGSSDEIGVSTILFRLVLALVIGAAAAGITLAVMRSKMNTAKPQKNAAGYMVGGSYDLYRCQDLFLYSRTSRVRRSEDSGGGHGGGRGGSTVHRSSSGRSHGGGHGKF